MTTLAVHRERVDAAQRVLAQGRKALHDQDGRRLYADHEHERREQQLRAEFRGTIAAAVEAAQAATAEADEVLDRSEADPVHRLSAADLERAVLLKQLVGERLLTAPLRDVDGEVQAALREGDRAVRYVTWRAVVDRRQGHVSAGIESARDLTGRLRAENSQEATALAGMAERLLATLVDVEARQQAREAAEARRNEALGIVAAAGLSSYMQAEYGPRQTPTAGLGAA